MSYIREGVFWVRLCPHLADILLEIYWNQVRRRVEMFCRYTLRRWVKKICFYGTTTPWQKMVLYLPLIRTKFISRQLETRMEEGLVYYNARGTRFLAYLSSTPRWMTMRLLPKSSSCRDRQCDFSTPWASPCATFHARECAVSPLNRTRCIQCTLKQCSHEITPKNALWKKSGFTVFFFQKNIFNWKPYWMRQYSKICFWYLDVILNYLGPGVYFCFCS